MEGKKTKNITNCKQFERLVELMEKNLELAKGFFTFGNCKAEYIEAWNNVAIQLNSLGPPIREGAGWQKVWNDLKNKIKKKLGHNKKEISATGGGSNNLYVFSQLEESIISLLSLEKTCSASNVTFGLVRNTQEPSISNTNNSSTQIINIQEPSSSSCNNISTPLSDDICIENVMPPIPQPSTITGQFNNNDEINQPLPPTANPNKRKRSISSNYQEERRQLLESQTQNIEEQTKHLKECARYTRKLYELNEKKYKQWSEIQNEKRKYRQHKMEYKLRNLEYKERKLALQEKQSKKN